MKQTAVLAVLFLLMLGCLFAAPLVGMRSIPLSAISQAPADSIDAMVLWNIRVPRVITALLAGAALSISGMAFQAMFRNPLAAPFTLGVSSGAALGAAIYLRLGLAFSVIGVSGVSMFAFLGATMAMAMVYGLTRLRGGFSTSTLLLGGVAISFSLSSMVLFVQYSANLQDSFRLIRWLMGGLGVVGYDAAFSILPFTVVGAAIVTLMPHELNLITTGDDIASSRGVDVGRVQKILFITVSFMVGGVVAVCGPIGFVGIMAPHICRLLVGQDHRYLTPACILFGALFLATCDTLARTIIAPAEIPVGIVTAMLGGPFFLWLLLTRSHETMFD
jgi:iron complex transport system permease protein